MGIYKRKGQYYIDYHVHGRRVREVVGHSKKLAESALQARQGDVVEGRFHLKKHSRTTFAEFAAQYLEHSQTYKRSYHRDQTILVNLTPFFGTSRLGDIDAQAIDRYITQRATQVRPGTVNRELVLLRHLLNRAVQWGKIDKSPWSGGKMLRVENLPERYLSREEEVKLLAACNGHMGPMVLMALNTGMRLNEIITLPWEQVDLEQRVITVLLTKNDRVRKIPINETLTAILRELKASSQSRFVFVYARTKRPVASVRTAWLAALRRSGIAHCRFHDLRHTFASRLVAAGVDLVVVKELMGHSTITMTVRYAHAAPESKLRAVASLDQGTPALDGHKSVTKRISDKLAKYVTHYQ
jgi:integrase